MEACLTGSTPFEGHFSHPHVLASRPSLASLYGTHQGSSRRLPFRIPSVLFEELDRTAAKPPRIVINVSGRVFEAPLPMFSRHPETLLGNPLKRIKFYDPHREEYFFSRDQQCAEAIVEYYQSGKLRRPQKIGLDLFLREVSFFEISVQAILRLCDEEGHQRMQPQHPPKHPACFRLWEFAMDPHSSRWALLYATTSLLMVLLSIVVFCLETVPMFHEKQHLAHSSLVPDLNDTMSHYSEKLEEERTQASRYGRFLEPIFLIESVCVAWFSMEFLLHFTVCPDKKRFIGSPLNIIDLLAIVPFYVQVCLSLALLTMESDELDSQAFSLTVLHILRLVRIFRILKLSQYSRGIRILGETFKRSFHELGLFLLFLAMGIVLFSSAIYFAELYALPSTEEPPQPGLENPFPSIPGSFYWAALTMTTVGFCGSTPRTVIGQLVGGACAISGLVAVALPLPVIVANFQTIYQKEKERHHVEEILTAAIGIQYTSVSSFSV